MPDGTPDLVAAAYSVNRAEVAMLAYKDGVARIMDAVTDRHLWLAGGVCDASVIDLADPAKSDSPLARTVEITFDGQDWFFAWDGKNLASITAPYYEWGPKDVPNSAMADTNVVDVDHSGPMQIVGNDGDGNKFPQADGISSTGTEILFRFNGKIYAPAETLLFLDEYKPQPSNWDASMDGSWADLTKGYIDMHHAPAPSYQLRIVNGDRDGSNRVTSAKIEINGQLVLSPTDVNQEVETLTETIQLQKQNEITVAVTGPPKSHLYVTVQ